VMNAAPKKQAGIASGVNNAVSRVAALLGIALLGIVIVRSFNSSLDQRLAEISAAPQLRKWIDEQRVRLAGAELPSNIDGRARLTLKQAIDESFVFGFRVIMLTAATVAAVSALVAFTMIKA